jgi:phosphonate transport system substrate-binding protein
MTETSEGRLDQGDRKKRTSPMLLLIMVAIAVGAFALGYWLTQVKQPLAENQKLNQESVTRTVGLLDARPLKLDERFKDADGDLLPDPPTDPKEMSDPPKLMFSYVATGDPEEYRSKFTELMAHLSKATGKPVEYVLFKNPLDELRAMRDGTLHIAGFSTGNVPQAVCWSGFVPFCRLASDADVSVYQMEILVPGDSEIRTIDGIRGHELTLTEPGSNSGFKAPLVLLKDHDLHPVRDFRIRYSNGHEESIMGIASKQYEAAAVANDVLSRELTAGRIKKEQFRSIYKSENFPTAAFGNVYNLKPELVKAIRDGFMSFQWKGTGLEKAFGPSGQTKFVPVNYKDDWALVRRIDSEIRSAQNLETLSATSETTDEVETTMPTTMTTRPAATMPTGIQVRPDR